MAIAVPNQWTTTHGVQDAQIQTLPTSGSWMVAAVAWRAVDGSNPSMAVADLPRNLWTLLGTADHDASGMHLQVWVCPKALYDGWSTLNVHTAAMAISATDVGSIDVNVFEVTGLSDAFTAESVTIGTATAATTFSATVPAPAGGVNCLMVAAAAVDNTAATVTVTSGGWTALTQVSNGNPDVKMAPAWRASTATQTPAWSSSVAANWVGVAVAIREVGTPVPQPNPNYPAVQTQIGLGFDTSTPLPAVSYTTVVGDHISTNHSRGIAADLGTAQSEGTDLEFLDRFGAFASRPVISATANAAGTTTTIKMADAQATGLVRGDWFRLWTSGGVLKEPTVFQISGIPTSSAGTTTITFTPAARVTTASTDVLTTTPVDLYTPYRQVATWGGKTYPVTSGWLETYKQTWPSPAYSLVDAVAVDALAMLSVDSPTALRGEIMRRNPTHYWPLNDPSGSAYAQNVSGYSQAQLVQTTSKYGAGSGAADFGASTQNVGPSAISIVGDGGSGWAQSGLVAADLPTKGFALVGQDSLFPAITTGVTIVGVSYVGDTNPISSGTIDPTLVILRNLDPGAGISAGSVIKVSITHTIGANLGRPVVTVWDQATHAATSTMSGSTSGMLAGWVRWALTFDRTSWSFYIDGFAVVSGSANLVPAFSGINVGGEADAFSNSRFYSALHAHVAVFGRRLSTQEITNIYSATRTGGLTSESSERRILRKLAVAKWKGARVLSLSALAPSAEGTDSATVADKANEVASYEDGLFFSDAAGNIQFRSRQQSYYQSSRATLGEDTASGEIPYTRDVSFELNPAFIYNLIRISNTIATTVNSTTTTSVASDPTSAGKYQTRAFERTIRVLNIADGFALACWLLARYAYPQRRVTQLTIDAGVNPSTFPFVLGVEVGDLVTVNRRPTYEPSTSRLYRVLHIAHDAAGAGHWVTTLTLAIAPPTAIVVGDPVKGIIGQGAIAA